MLKEVDEYGGVRSFRSICVCAELGTVTGGEKKEGRGELLSQGIYTLWWRKGRQERNGILWHDEEDRGRCLRRSCRRS